MIIDYCSTSEKNCFRYFIQFSSCLQWDGCSGLKYFVVARQGNLKLALGLVLYFKRFFTFSGGG